MDNQTTEQPAQSDPIVETTTDQSQTSVLSGEQTTQNNFQELIPEEYRAEKSLENFKDMGDFVKSYLSAQKIVGADKIPVPNKFATEKDWDAVYQKLGRPEDASGYKYDLPEDQTIDETALKNFSDQAHKLG